jgi:hypothetical protein
MFDFLSFNTKDSLFVRLLRIYTYNFWNLSNEYQLYFIIIRKPFIFILFLLCFVIHARQFDVLSLLLIIC